jgi:hypothetical protein
MTPTECLREADVVDAIAAGSWPDQAPAELHAHVATCAVCADLALVAAGLHEDGVAAREALAAVPLPSAGQVWWRAELRARQEKALLAQRPIAAVQVVALVAVGLMLASGLWAFAPDAWTWLTQAGTEAVVASARDLTGWGLLVVGAVAFWVIVAPVAVLMVLRADRQGGR